MHRQILTVMASYPSQNSSPHQPLKRRPPFPNRWLQFENHSGILRRNSKHNPNLRPFNNARNRCLNNLGSNSRSNNLSNNGLSRNNRGGNSPCSRRDGHNPKPHWYSQPFAQACIAVGAALAWTRTGVSVQFADSRTWAIDLKRW